jgi:hypothetical protein
MHNGFLGCSDKGGYPYLGTVKPEVNSLVW